MNMLIATFSVRTFFLSCLCGSERHEVGDLAFAVFLSCLCGSEHKSIMQPAISEFSELPVRQ